MRRQIGLCMVVLAGVSALALLHLSAPDTAHAQCSPEVPGCGSRSGIPTPTPTPTQPPCTVFKFESYTTTGAAFEERDLTKLVHFNGNQTDPFVQHMANGIRRVIDICHQMRDIDDAAVAAGCPKNTGHDGPVGCRNPYYASCITQMTNIQDYFGRAISPHGMCWTMIQDGRADKGVQACGYYGIMQWALDGGDFGGGFLTDPLQGSGVNFWSGWSNVGANESLPGWFRDALASTNFSNGPFPLNGTFKRTTFFARMKRDTSGNLLLNANGTPQIEIEPVPLSSDLVCEGALGGDATPISLILDEEAFAKEEFALVNFGLNGKNGWSAWRASDAAPLLVKLAGESTGVLSAQQLFGSWAGGGKIAVSGREPYSDGFEALATEDKNGDGKVSGVETNTLALWSDSNRDGRADRDEVKALGDLGIHTLYFRSPKRQANGDLALKLGYERLVNGRNVSGRALDWIAPTADTAERLMTLLNVRGGMGGSSIPAVHSANESPDQSSSSVALNEVMVGEDKQQNSTATRKRKMVVHSEPTDVSGIWQFTLAGRVAPSGFLLIRRDRTTNQVAGSSVLVTRAPNQAAVLTDDRIVQIFEIRGKTSTVGNAGSWVLPGDNGSLTHTTFEIREGKLVGESKARFIGPKGSPERIRYQWSAERLG